jgi:hypothetical protein
MVAVKVFSGITVYIGRGEEVSNQGRLAQRIADEQVPHFEQRESLINLCLAEKWPARSRVGRGLRATKLGDAAGSGHRPSLSQG